MKDQVNRATTPLRITVGADRAPWLEQHHVDVSTCPADHPVPHRDPILLGINPGREGLHHVTIHGDMAILDQFLAGTARGDASLGQHLLEPRPPRVVGKGMG